MTSGLLDKNLHDFMSSKTFDWNLVVSSKRMPCSLSVPAH